MATTWSPMPSPEFSLPDWTRTHGLPVFQGVIKQSVDDFIVTESLGFQLTGEGEHDFLWIEKRDANTAWVARALARHAGVPTRDVGYSGLKDRRAITRQWFSVRRPGGGGTDWEPFELDGVRILEATRHNRKLRRGSHADNHFRIAVRGERPGGEVLSDRLTRIRVAGVPNYFGPQRFGRQGGNIRLAQRLFAGERLRRDDRSIALSAARSFVFNEVLAERVAAGTWNRPLPGEAVNLDGRGSYFMADEVTAEIEARADALEVHPTGPLWGRGSPACSGDAAALEREVAARHEALVDGLVEAGMDGARRALRLAVRDLEWQKSAGCLELEFRLCRGAFATAVLREIVSLDND
jgi:tRNA pseudouridine13 synthase